MRLPSCAQICSHLFGQHEPNLEYGKLSLLKVEQCDFTTVSKNLENGGRSIVRFHKKMEANNATMIDYYITLDMAKELSMVERNETGI